MSHMFINHLLIKTQILQIHRYSHIMRGSADEEASFL